MQKSLSPLEISVIKGRATAGSSMDEQVDVNAYLDCAVDSP